MSNFDLYGNMPEGEAEVTVKGKAVAEGEKAKGKMVGYDIKNNKLKALSSDNSSEGDPVDGDFRERAPLRAGGIASTLGNQVEPLNKMRWAGSKPLSEDAPRPSAHELAATKYQTRATSEGSTKRNIVRRGSGGGGGGGGSSKGFGARSGGGGRKWERDVLDDGSMDVVGKLSKNDPNYDSDEERLGDFVFGSYDEGAAMFGATPPRLSYLPDGTRVIGPIMTLSEYKRRVDPALREYFDSGDATEFLRVLEELQCPEYSFELTKRAISMALDRRGRECELVSRLLSAAYPKPMTSDMLGKGFSRVFESLGELSLDVPRAPLMVATFLARAVVDDILPPAYLSDPYNVQLGGQAVDYARRMLTRDHAAARLARAWGPNEGATIDDLKKSFDLLVQEFVDSRKLNEAVKCVTELGVPNFHHELVKRAIHLAMDLDQDARDAIMSLLAELVKRGTIAARQVTSGVDKLYIRLPDMILDSPGAADVLSSITTEAIAVGWLEKDYAPPAPLPTAS